MRRRTASVIERPVMSKLILPAHRKNSLHDDSAPKETLEQKVERYYALIAKV